MPYADKEKAREYQRKYHLNNWAKRKVKHNENKRKRRAILANWLKTYKEDLACISCGESHPACLDFHHVNSKEKEGTVANMISEGYSLKTIQTEIDKCIILCRNCHAKRHYGIGEKTSSKLL